MKLGSFYTSVTCLISRESMTVLFYNDTQSDAWRIDLTTHSHVLFDSFITLIFTANM